MREVIYTGHSDGTLVNGRVYEVLRNVEVDNKLVGRVLINERYVPQYVSIWECR